MNSNHYQLFTILIGFRTASPIFQRVIYRALGYHIHSAARVYPQCFCGAGKGKLVVGKGSYVNYRCFLDLGADIIIGKPQIRNL